MADNVTEEIKMRKGAIHCAGCEPTIERFLSRVPGVQAVKASEKTQVVNVTWDPEQATEGQLREKLVELGFEPAG